MRCVKFRKDLDIDDKFYIYFRMLHDKIIQVEISIQYLRNLME